MQEVNDSLVSVNMDKEKLAKQKKIQELDIRREEEGFDYQIEVDGGINRETVKLCYDRGVTLAVMGTAFFKEDDKKTFVQEIINSL